MAHDQRPTNPPSQNIELGRHAASAPPAQPSPAAEVVGLGRHAAAPPTPTPQAGAPFRPYKLEFTGTTGEYFRIWIVNLALSVITLGIFLPWANVRQRAYLYGHTRLDGHGFEYTADPKALLRGYLLAGGLFLIFNISLEFADSYPMLWWLVVPLFILFLVIYPWLIMKSLKFNAYNSRYRNVRFYFSGEARGAYGAYMGGNLLSSVTLGLTLPVAWFWQRSYQFSNLWYGRTKVNFRGDLGEFYAIGLKAFGIYILAVVSAFALIAVGAAGFAAVGSLLDESALGMGFILGIVGIAVVYLLILAAANAAWQYANASILKYVLERSNLGGVLGFSSRINEWQLVWIGISNALAQLVTLGLATPWATIRRQRYIVNHLTVMSQTDLNDFSGATRQEQDAWGEAATEVFGMELGL